jgi:phosphoadenosine phosphosulfate reductase
VIVDADLVARANERLAKLHPVAILARVHAAFGPKAAILSSMQRSGAILCHMAHRVGLDLDVAFVDTGVLHPETLATRDALQAAHPGLRVVTLQPAETFAAQTRRLGVLYLSKEGQEQCCDLRKSAPLRAVRGQWDALIGALSREEGGRRAAVPFLALDEELGALRVHPLAATTRAELDAYAAANPDVVRNPLHDMGFPSIGCYTCTTPVRPDEPERAGRWRHLADVTYCGINPTDRGAAPATIEIDDAYAPFFDT